MSANDRYGAGQYGPTPGQRFADAVWAAPGEGDEGLSPSETLVALAYAKAAKPGADTAWLTQRLLMRMCKFRSNATPARVRKALIHKGWLVPIDVMLIRGGRVTVFRLVVPGSDLLTGQGGQRSDPLSGSGHLGSDPLSKQGDPESGLLNGQGEKAVHSVGQVNGRSDLLSRSVGDGKRPTQTIKEVLSVPESDLLSRSRFPKHEHPIGGAQSGARAGAPVPAREAAAQGSASQDQTPDSEDQASENGYAAMTRDEALAHLRASLPPGKPFRRYPQIGGGS